MEKIIFHPSKKKNCIIFRNVCWGLFQNIQGGRVSEDKNKTGVDNGKVQKKYIMLVSLPLDIFENLH